MKKKFIAALCLACCVAMFTGCVNNPSDSGGNDDGGGTTQTEGTLSISNVYQYLGYAKVKINTKMDGKAVDNLDLYYDIVDREVCTIENGYVDGLKIGTTKVYAQTIAGQEVEFDVTINDPQEFDYNSEVLSHEDAMRTKFKDIKNPTLFVGDSYFDIQYCWKTFDTDLEGLNCISVGLSGSHTTHWMAVRDRLIRPYEPKNIVLHIGTNDINSSTNSVDQCYKLITDFLALLVEEYPQAQIYYFGIENRKGEMGGRNQYSLAVTEKIKNEFAVQYSNFHYLDTPTIFNANQDKYMGPDNIHLAPEGYKVYTEMLKQNVQF